MMVERLLTHLVRFVLGHRLLVVILVGLVSLLSLSILPRAIIASSLQSMFFGHEHAGYNSYLERISKFGTDEIFMFGIEVDDPLSATTLTRLDTFRALALANPEVRTVQSVANLQRVGLVGDTIGVRNFGELAREAPDDHDALLAEIRGDPIAGGLFVSADHPDILVMVENQPNPAREAEDGPAYVAGLRAQLVEAGFDNAKIHPAGFMAIMAAMIAASQDNLARMFPLVSLALLLAVYLMFGRFWPVFVTTLSALVAVLWTSAFTIYSEPTVNILMSILPTFVLIISFSDVVHICSAYLLNLESGASKHDAISNATVEVGAACLLTSITTAVGFFALTFVPAPAFQNLGLAAAVGVVIAFGLAMVIVPIFLSVLPTPSDWHAGRVGWVQDALDRLLDGLADLTTTRPWPVIAAFCVFFAVCVYGSSRINIETKFAERLDENNAARVDARYMDARFVKASLIDVYIDTPDRSGVLDATRFAKLVAFEAELETWPEVEKVVSFVDLMRVTHRSVVGDGAEFGPFDDAALAQMMVLLEMQGPDALRSFVDFERRTARLTVYSNVEGIVGQFELRERIRAAGVSLGDDVTIEATGVGPLMGAWLDDILAGQRRGLGFSLLVIMLLLIVGFRSVRAGVVSMVPNVVPLLAAGAWCGFFWTDIDSDTLIVAMIALGIGVDDTIHFISRYQTELRRRDRIDAIRETFRYSGRGIFITTFVFVVGFLPAMTSEYYTIWVMGLLLPVCFIVALAADVLFVPALCAVGLIR